MTYEFKFPDVGEGITEGRLIRWLVKEGETVKEDQPVAEVETDKSVVEIPSPKTGRIIQLLHKEKDVVETGKTLLIMEVGSSLPSRPDIARPDIAAPAATIPATAKPTVGPTTGQTTGHEPARQALDVTQAFQSQPRYNAEILSLPSVRHLAKERGIDISVIKGSGKDGRIMPEDLGGTAIPKVQPVLGQTSAGPRTIVATVQSATSLPPAGQDVLATPAIRRLAREMGIDINLVKGSGPSGAVTKDDIDRSKAMPDIAGTGPAFNSVPIVSTSITEEHLHKKPESTQLQNQKRIPLSMMRLAIANKMVESVTNAVQVTHMDQVDLTSLVAVREKEKEALAAKGVKLTYLPFIIKATIIGLKAFPNMNAEIDMKAKEMIQKSYYNIGFALDMGDGLIVPVIRDADKKSIVELARELTALSELGRQGKLSADEMKGSTFTITSIGSIGGEGFTPIINYPEAAILGVGTIKDKPAVIDGKIVPRKIVTLSVTYDHRLVDGAYAARFLQAVKTHLEDPELLFIDA